MTELIDLASEPLFSAQEIDRTALRDGHQPGARVARDARLRPLLERRDQRILSEILGKTDVAHDPREAGDHPRRLDPPDRIDRAMRVGDQGARRSVGASGAALVDVEQVPDQPVHDLPHEDRAVGGAQDFVPLVGQHQIAG